MKTADDVIRSYPWISRFLARKRSWMRKAQREFSKRQKPASTGWIVIFSGATISRTRPDWISDLDSPESFRPGCLAVPVSPDDDFYVSCGGNYEAGSREWVKVCSAE